MTGNAGPSPMSNTALFWSVIGLVVLGCAVTVVNDIAGLFVFMGGGGYLVHRQRGSAADILGLLLVVSVTVPFARRLHDFRTGWTPMSLVLMAPYGCVAPLVPPVVRNIRKLRRFRCIPLVMVLAAVFYSFTLGVGNFGLYQASVGLMEWNECLLLFTYFVVVLEAADYDRLGIWFGAIMLVEVAYGLYQWTAPPPWDAQWLNDSRMFTSMGTAAPFMMRTFATTNSTGVLAFLCGFYLVGGINWKGYIFLSIPVFVALVTTMVRASWITTVSGIVVAFVISPMSARLRFIKIFLVIGLVLTGVAVSAKGRFPALESRFASLGNLEHDGSANERKGLVQYAIQTLLNLPEGAGMGSVGRGARISGQGIAGLDNGFIAIIYIMGWIGSFMYMGGFLAYGGVLLWRSRRFPDKGPVVALAFCLFASNVFGPSFSDICGILCWSSLAFGFLDKPTDPVAAPA